MQRTTALIRYRASDSVPERTDRTRRYPIPPRHPHRKIRKSGDKFLSPLFRIRFFSRRDSGLHLRKERQKLRDGIRLRTLPLRPQRPPPPVVFSPVVFPINAFPDDASADFNAFFRKIPANIPFSVRQPHDDNRKTGHLVSSHDDPADRTPRIAARREAVHTGRQDETKKASCRKPSRTHPAMRGDHTGGNANGRTSTARPPAAGRSERTVRNIIKIIEKRMERKRSTAGLTCGKHGPSPDGCPSP